MDKASLQELRDLLKILLDQIEKALEDTSPVVEQDPFYVKVAYTPIAKEGREDVLSDVAQELLGHWRSRNIVYISVTPSGVITPSMFDAQFQEKERDAIVELLGRGHLARNFLMNGISLTVENR